MESIYALFVTLILVFPLVAQLQMLIADPKKLCTIFHYYASTPLEDHKKARSPRILKHYTVEPSVYKTKDSTSKMLLTSLRSASSSPNIARVSTRGRTGVKNDTVQLARHSSTFVKTGQVLPVVDIGCTYSSYRYKAFMHCLKNYYGERYPPGEVVLNLMQLNLFDSCTNIGEVFTGGLFDFLKEERNESQAVASRPEIEYLNPLDHFVARQAAASVTVERCTETDERPDCASPEGGIEPVINDREKYQLDRRSSRKIEAHCKYCSSSSRRGTNDSRSGQPVERGRSQTSARCYGVD